MVETFEHGSVRGWMQAETWTSLPTAELNALRAALEARTAQVAMLGVIVDQARYITQSYPAGWIDDEVRNPELLAALKGLSRKVDSVLSDPTGIEVSSVIREVQETLDVVGDMNGMEDARPVAARFRKVFGGKE